MMIASINLCRLLTAMSCFKDKRDDETTHYLKPPQAYIVRTIFVVIYLSRQRHYNSKHKFNKI